MKAFHGAVGNAPMKLCPLTKELCKHVYLRSTSTGNGPECWYGDVHRVIDMLKACPQEGKKK